MQHIGGVCDPSPSHVKSMAAIGRELEARGLRFTLFQRPEVAPLAKAFGVSFHPVGSASALSGPEKSRQTANRQGVSLAGTNQSLIRGAELFCQYGPEELRSLGVDLLIVDQGEPGGATVADRMGIPFVSFCSAVPLNYDPLVPLSFLHWNCPDSWWALQRNRASYAIRNRLMSPVFAALNRYRRAWGLQPYRTPDDSFSRLAQFSQMVPLFDFPRAARPGCFHYVGPYEREAWSPAEFPWHLLDGRPLIYASLGTIVGNRPGIWRMFAAVCAGLNVQVVISLGRQSSAEEYRNLPGNPVVVEYAPQMELLKRASLLFTHAGLNTVMEALACAVPMVAIPIAFDQPGVGSRLSRCGAGKVVRLSNLSEPELRKNIEQVLSDSKYRRNAQAIRGQIGNTGGAAEAADLIERVFSTQQPVLSAGR